MTRNAELINGMWPYNEFTARQYAAIHLLQPSSGLDWLDDMIRARMRDEMAGRALIALSEIIKDAKIGENDAARYAFLYADAMMKQREER